MALIDKDISPFGERSGAEVLDEVKTLVKRLAMSDYPDVWVGEVGMTATELLELQELNEGLPEEMQVEPGEVVSAEGTEGGIHIPEVGGTRLNGLDVVLHLRDEMEEGQFEDLRHEVRCIGLAKEDRVSVTVSRR